MTVTITHAHYHKLLHKIGEYDINPKTHFWCYEKTMQITKAELYRVLSKIQDLDESCRICGSGLCIVCNGYNLLYDRPQRTFENRITK